MQQRVDWIDSLREWCIIAVVLGHFTYQLPWHGIIIYPLADSISTVLAPFRMGLMFFVSGLFVEAGMRRPNFIKNKVYSILWPFLVWSTIYAAVKIVFSGLVNNSFSPLGLFLSSITGGQSTIWFLHNLFLFFILIPFVRKVPAFIVLPVCLILSEIAPPIPSDSIFSGIHNNRISAFFYMFCFFYLGDYVVRKSRNNLSFYETPKILLVSILSFLTVVTLKYFGLLTGRWASPIVFASIPFFVVLASKANYKLVLYIGKHAIVFYVLHQLLVQAIVKFIKSEIFYSSSVAFAFAFAFIFLVCWIFVLARKYLIFDLLFSSKKTVSKLFG